jgi:hypothetical protein
MSHIHIHPVTTSPAPLCRPDVTKRCRALRVAYLRRRCRRRARLAVGRRRQCDTQTACGLRDGKRRVAQRVRAVVDAQTLQISQHIHTRPPRTCTNLRWIEVAAAPATRPHSDVEIGAREARRVHQTRQSEWWRWSMSMHTRSVVLTTLHSYAGVGAGVGITGVGFGCTNTHQSSRHARTHTDGAGVGSGVGRGVGTGDGAGEGAAVAGCGHGSSLMTTPPVVQIVLPYIRNVINDRL